jgi:hypothetical protein
VTSSARSAKERHGQPADQQRSRQLRALAAIDRQILDATELDPVLKTLFARLDELIPGTLHFALIVDPDEPQHGRLYSSRTGAIAMQRVVIGDELHRWLGRTSVEAGATPAQLESLGFATDSSLSSCVFSVAPMAGEPAPGALIAAKRDGSRLSRSDIGSLREFAARIAVALAASKREAELFRRAHYDSLTGLPNRELLHDRLHQAVAQAQREEHPLAVLFVDLDSFKAINDTHGHPAGDDVLKETALRHERGAARDTVARPAATNTRSCPNAWPRSRGRRRQGHDALHGRSPPRTASRSSTPASALRCSRRRQHGYRVAAQGGHGDVQRRTPARGATAFSRKTWTAACRSSMPCSAIFATRSPQARSRLPITRSER